MYEKTWRRHAIALLSVCKITLQWYVFITLVSNICIEFVIVYAPRSEITNKNSEITINFYNDVCLNNLLNQINNKSSIILVAGDFSGETGKKTDIGKCLRNFFGGRRNQDGQYLTNLCTNHDLLITNTCFRHKEKRLITWEQTRIAQGKLQKLKKTIDYICIPYKYKHILENSRTYHGTITASDHKLLVTKMKTKWLQIYKNANKQKNPKNRKFNTWLLINDKKTQAQYRNKIHDRINNN